METTDNKQFNNLEKAVLEWFVTNYKDENLTAQIRSTRLKEREWTKVGFYISMEVPHDLRPIDFPGLPQIRSVIDARPISSRILSKIKSFVKPEIKKNFALDGPFIKSEDIELNGGSVLFCKDGYINYLEMYAFGHLFKEHVGNFELSLT